MLLFKDRVFLLPLVFLAASRTVNRVLLDRRRFESRTIHCEAGENEFPRVWALDEYSVHKVLGEMGNHGSCKRKTALFRSVQADQSWLSRSALDDTDAKSAPELKLFGRGRLPRFGNGCESPLFSFPAFEAQPPVFKPWLDHRLTVKWVKPSRCCLSALVASVMGRRASGGGHTAFSLSALRSCRHDKPDFPSPIL